MTRQVGNEIDEFVVEAVRSKLLGLPLDLPALNIARGRETGIPSFNHARAQILCHDRRRRVKALHQLARFRAEHQEPDLGHQLHRRLRQACNHSDQTTAAGKRDAAMELRHSAVDS